MSKAHIARLAVWLAAIVLTLPVIVYATRVSGDPAWGLLEAIVGAFVASILAELAFSSRATPEQIRADLEDRLRNRD